MVPGLSMQAVFLIKTLFRPQQVQTREAGTIGYVSVLNVSKLAESLMWRYRQTSRSNETGKVFKGNQPLSNDLRETLFSEGCFPSGRGRRGGWRPYGKGAVCLYWDLTAAERGASVRAQVNVCWCVCVCVGEGWNYSAHILMRCQGKLPSLTFPLSQSVWG